MTALEKMRASGWDLVLLDVMLPGKDGFTVLREMRKAGDHTPVILLTARGQEQDRVTGLSLGGDDHVTKPFLRMAHRHGPWRPWRTRIVNSAGEKGIYRVDLNTGAATLVTAAPDPRMIALAPDGITLYYYRNAQSLVARDLKTGAERTVTDGGPGFSGHGVDMS